MTRVLLTGGSGFVAAHVLEALLARGHSVVTTVRSQKKAEQIQRKLSQHKGQLDFAIVEDIAKIDAFDEAIVSDPPFEAIIHTASPYHYKATDVQKELYEPAVNGTLGILRATKKYTPTVRRVVITSSFAAMNNPKKPAGEDYSEKDFNPETAEQGLEDPIAGYRISKKLAESAAWEFMDAEKPSFSLAVLNPPMIYGPVAHHLSSLKDVNTSNERFRDFMSGSYRAKCLPTAGFFWVDVRDLAQAHVLAMEKAEAANQRFFIAEGPFCNKEIAVIMADRFPEYKDGLPITDDALAPGDYPPGPRRGVDNAKSKEVLGIQYRSLKETTYDTVKSLQTIPA